MSSGYFDPAIFFCTLRAQILYPISGARLYSATNNSLMRILIILIALLPLRGLSQDFTGVWTGFIFTSNVRLPYELIISESNNALTGYSLTVFTVDDIEHTGIKFMKIKGKKRKIAIEDGDLIFNDYGKRPKRVVLYSTLSLEQEEDSILVLQGSFFTRSLDRSMFTGTIRLEKNKDFSGARMIAQLKKMDLWNDLSISESESNKKNASSVTVEKNDKVLPPDSTALNAEMTATTPKPVNKSEVAHLPEQTTKIEPASPPGSAILKPDITITTANSVNKSDIANLPEQKTKIDAELPPDSTVLKPDMTVTTPKSVNKSDVANLPEQKTKIESVGFLPEGKAKPGIVARSVAEDIASRKTEVIRSIFVQSDSLVLTLYDNGEIDGDTVSVVVNDKIIIARQVLGINAIKATVHVPRDSGDSLSLIMYAENLGRIPPNTGLLIVQDGNERYQIRFSGDYQKNSAIILRRKR